MAGKQLSRRIAKALETNRRQADALQNYRDQRKIYDSDRRLQAPRGGETKRSAAERRYCV